MTGWPVSYRSTYRCSRSARTRPLPPSKRWWPVGEKGWTRYNLNDVCCEQDNCCLRSPSYIDGSRARYVIFFLTSMLISLIRGSKKKRYSRSSMCPPTYCDIDDSLESMSRQRRRKKFPDEEKEAPLITLLNVVVLDRLSLHSASESGVAQKTPPLVLLHRKQIFTRDIIELDFDNGGRST